MPEDMETYRSYSFGYKSDGSYSCILSRYAGVFYILYFAIQCVIIAKMDMDKEKVWGR